jgi:hypothetical protein
LSGPYTQLLGDPVRTAAAAAHDLEQLIENLHGDTAPVTVIRTCIAAVYADRLAGCREPICEVVRARREVGDHVATIPMLHLLGLEAWLAGRWDDSAEYIAEAYTPRALHANNLNAWSGRYAEALVAAAT